MPPPKTQPLPPPTPTLRSLYRALLRELPPRPLSAPASPLHLRIRATFTQSPPPPPSSSPSRSTTTTTTTTIITPPGRQPQFEQATQYLQYVRAQRMYATLLERYNPGIGGAMDEEERVRLTARRVGMELPDRGGEEERGGGGRGGGRKQ